MTDSIQVHDTHSIISNEETSLQDFRVITKKSWEKCFLGTTYITVNLAYIQIFNHTIVCYPLRMDWAIIRPYNAVLHKNCYKCYDIHWTALDNGL